MNAIDAIKTCFIKYIVVSGRASRSEFWYYVLFCVLFSFVIAGLDLIFFQSHDTPLSNLFILITIIPSFTVTIRRLHDIGKSGYWYLLFFTIIGGIVLIYWFTKSGSEEENKYGKTYIPEWIKSD